MKDIDLTVASGEIMGIIGRSGAGKSTLIRCINLLERPSTGEDYDGRDLLYDDGSCNTPESTSTNGDDISTLLICCNRVP